MKLEEMNDAQLLARTLLLADGLSTNVFFMFYSKMIDTDLVKEYIRVDSVFKNYLSKNILTIRKSFLIVFCNFYQNIWRELFDVLAQVDLPFDNNFLTEINSRKTFFDTSGLTDYDYS